VVGTFVASGGRNAGSPGDAVVAGIVEHELTVRCEGFLAEPVDGPARVGVVVLSGSSGRIERERCRMFARAGVSAVSVRWFGGPGQPPGICEIPLESFVAAAELLRERGSQRVSLLGVSKGAEASLLVSTLSDCADAVIALAPTSVVWANVGPGRDGHERPCRSSWTWQGRPLPFAASGRRAALISRPDAGHRTVFPGEVPPPRSTLFDHGGTPEADAALGAAAWPAVRAAVLGP